MGVRIVLFGLGLCFFLLGGALGVGQDVRLDLVWRIEGLSLCLVIVLLGSALGVDQVVGLGKTILSLTAV